jgi:hypothetical protein
MENKMEIPGYEGLYYCNSSGEVFSYDRSILYSNGLTVNHKGKKLRQEISKGYFRVSLSKNNVVKRFLVHRLIAACFIENANDKRCVNHIDGNKQNNNVSNLEWVSHSENERHSYDSLGKVNGNRKMSSEDVLYVLESKETGISLSLKFNVSPKVISNIRRNVYYKA